MACAERAYISISLSTSCPYYYHCDSPARPVDFVLPARRLRGPYVDRIVHLALHSSTGSSFIRSRSRGRRRRSRVEVRAEEEGPSPPSSSATSDATGPVSLATQLPNGMPARGGNGVGPLEGGGQAMANSIECIGTGTDVECVIPDSNQSIATRAINRQEMRIELAASSSEKEPLVKEAAIADTIEPGSIVKDIWEYLFLISPFFFWGTAMVAMKGVLLKAGPLFVASVRLIPSGLLVVAFASYQKRKQPSGINAWLAIGLFALVDASCFQGFLAEGLRRTSAGLGSVIIDSQPLTVAVLASLLFGEAIGVLGIVGLATGVIGLLLLEVPVQVLKDLIEGHGLIHLSNSTHLDSELQQNNWSIWDSGEWWMLLAAQSMAVGTVMVRWLCQFSDPIMATGWHMVLGGLPLLLLAYIQHDPAVAGHIQDLEIGDWMALAYTSVFGSAISYGVFFYNASRGSLTRLSSLTFLTPMFAALFGYLVLDETLSSIQIVGAVVTLASIYLINTRPDQKQEEL